MYKKTCYKVIESSGYRASRNDLTSDAKHERPQSVDKWPPPPKKYENDEVICCFKYKKT